MARPDTIMVDIDVDIDVVGGVCETPLKSTVVLQVGQRCDEDDRESHVSKQSLQNTWEHFVVTKASRPQSCWQIAQTKAP